MQTKQEAITYCLSFEQVYEDYPFHDSNWCVMRHKGSKKTFALIYNKDGHVWINVKCDPQWRDFWRSTFSSVVPAYHMNKSSWITAALDGSVPAETIELLLDVSYELTKPKPRRKPVNRKEPDDTKN